MTPTVLLERLDAIGRSLADEADALALLGLGSVGAELDRLDEWSDLDFFAIVERGHGPRFRDDLAWLERVAPIAHRFRNTVHGSKVLFADGIFCEFAVFEPAELADATFTAPRIVWRADRFPPEDATPSQPPRAEDDRSLQDLVDEALTNLYVGLLRERRGERMAACRMIQGHALDRIMEIAGGLEPPTGHHRDPFGPERRIEMRCPVLADRLGDLAPGYTHNRSAASACLEVLETYGDVAPAMRGAIVRLLDAP